MKQIIIPLCFFFLCGCKKEATDKVLVNNNPLDGTIFMAPFNNGDNYGKLWEMDKSGNVQKEVITGGIAMNMQKWNINGNTRYTYLVEDHNGYHIPGFTGYVPGYEIIADENLNELKRVYLLSHGDIDAGSKTTLDSHDFILLADDHYIADAYYDKPVNNIPEALHPATNVRVIAPVIQEVENGQVIWQWDGTDFPELYAESVEGNEFSDNSAVRDYLHLNSMTIDPADSNLVCSFRNANLILKINRHTGDIMWKLGGPNSDFPLTDDQRFLRQHHVSFADNGATLMVFDNGEINERPYSRILEFGLDQSGHQFSRYKSFNIPGKFVQFMGSVQKFGDRYFIGGGTGKYIMEVNSLTGEKTFEMDLLEFSYRAYKYQ